MLNAFLKKMLNSISVFMEDVILRLNRMESDGIFELKEEDQKKNMF
jgi:hypothetical protein